MLISLILISILVVRLGTDKNSAFLPTETLSESVLFEIGTQAPRITSEVENVHISAVVSWAKGTNIFFTNEHVTDNVCNKEDICNFKEADSFDLSYKERTLRKKVCLPLQDLCVLQPVDESVTTNDFQFASVSNGEEVYYVDVFSKDFRLFRGTVLNSSDENILIQGYSRHGFSGSPVFNTKGKIVGIISKLESNIFMILPHYFIYGWAQANKFSATRWPTLDWIKKDQKEIVQIEWEKALRKFRSNFQTSLQSCSSFWTSKKVVISFLFLAATWQKYTGDRSTDLMEMGQSKEPSWEQLCVAVLKTK